MICLSIKLPFNMCHFCLQAYEGIHEIGKSSATSQARKVGQLFIHPNYTPRTPAGPSIFRRPFCFFVKVILPILLVKTLRLYSKTFNTNTSHFRYSK